MKQSLSRRTFLTATSALAGVLALDRVALAQAASRLTWWYDAALPEHQAALDEVLVKPFNEVDPSVQLAIEYRGSALSDQLMVAVAANDGPDIVMTNGPSWTDRLVGAGKLASLDDYAEEYRWREKLPAFMLDLGSTDGVLYALPKTVETQVLFFNKTVFEENGYAAPKDRAEFEAIADDCLAKGIIPIAAGNAGQRFSNRWHVSIVWNAYAGPDAIYKALAGEMPWNSEPFVEAIVMLKEWWDKGYFGGQNYFSINSQQAFTLMAAGRYAMSPQGTWALQWIPDSFAKSGHELDWAPLPRLRQEADYPVFPLGIGAHLAVNEASKNKDAAARMLNMLTDPVVLGDLSRLWTGEWDVPILESIPAPNEKYALMSQAIKAQTAAATAQNTYGYTPWSFWPPKTDDYMKAAIEEVWLGQLTPQQFCDNVQKVFEEEVAAGVVKSPPSRT